MTQRDGGSVGAAEAEARRALDAYPGLAWVGVAYACLERVGPRWRTLATGLESPQQARDHLAHLLLLDADQAAGEAEREELRATAYGLDDDPRNEVCVAGRLFRIGRVDRSVRMGPDGPEPPRPSDPDRAPGEPDPAPRCLGFIDGLALRGTAAAVLRYELSSRVPDSGGREREDARRSLDSHPRLVLLPVEFTVAEEVEGRWRPLVAQTFVTPQGAREQLMDHLRPTRLAELAGDARVRDVYARLQELIDSRRPGPEVCAEWERAAERLERERLDDLRTAGYHFRVIRVDQVLRLGVDGPEPPRPSDADSLFPG
jgi:hypothetical protein